MRLDKSTSSILDNIFGKGKDEEVPKQASMSYPDIYIPMQFVDSIRQAETAHSLPTNLLPRLLKTESNFNPAAIGPVTKSGEQARGIAQIMPSMHPDVDPMNAEESIQYSAKYLSDLYAKHRDWNKTLAFYGGFGGDVEKAKRYIGKITGGNGQIEEEGESTNSILNNLFGPENAVNPAAPYYKANLEDWLAEQRKPPMKAAEIEPEKFSNILMGTQTTAPKILAEPPKPKVLSYFERFDNAFTEVVNFLPSMVKHGYELWKKGDFPGMVDFASGGLLTNTIPQLVEAEKNIGMIRGEEQIAKPITSRIINTVGSITKAVPFFGPMTAIVEDHLKSGQYPEAAGATAGILTIAKVPQVVHAKIAEASAKSAIRARLIEEETARRQTETAKITDPEKQQVELQQIQTEKIEQIKNVVEEEGAKAAASVNTNVAASKIKKAKGERTPEEVMVAKEKMAKVRAAKRPVGEVKIVPPTAEEISKSTQAIQEALRPIEPEKPGTLAQPTPEKPLAGVEEPVRPKIGRTKPVEEPKAEQPVLTQSDYELLDKQYGEDGWLELPDEEIAKFLNENRGKVLEERLAEKPTETVSTMDEADKWLAEHEKVAEQAPQVEELDSPILESVFDTDAEGTLMQQSAYARNKAVASNIDELLNPAPKSVKDPGATFWKLQNDVNRWRYGDSKIDIEATRTFLSDMAANADQFKSLFDSEYEFEDWRDTVQEAAKWARDARRPSEGTQLYSGIPVDRILKLFRAWHGTSDRYIKPGEAVGKYLLPKSHRDIVEEVVGLFPKDKQTGVREWLEKSEYFSTGYDSVKEEVVSRAVDTEKRVFTTGDYAVARDYAKWAGEAYDNALLELSNYPDQTVKTIVDGLYKSARAAKPIVLRVETSTKPRRRGDTISNEPLKIIGVFDAESGTKLYSGIPVDKVLEEFKGLWRSKLKEDVQTKLPNIAPAEQIANTLRKGVTQDEWNRSGLAEFLKPGTKVRKEEVVEQIERNTPVFKDVVLEQSPNINTRRYGELISLDSARGLTDAEHRELINLERIIEHDLPRIEPRFSSYIEPGGTNYKELFVTAPSKEIKISREQFDLERSNLSQQVRDDLWRQVQNKELIPNEELSLNPRWKDGHSDYADIENPIVRLRFNDREVISPENSKRIDSLRVRISDLSSEINSYMKVYNGKTTPEKTGLSALLEADRLSQERHKLEVELDQVKSLSQKVLFIEEMQPPNPENQAKMPPEFVKRWREIGMKRAIKYGVDGGYDKVAWTTGEMQQQRYPGTGDLIGRVEATRIDSGITGSKEQQYHITAYDKNEFKISKVHNTMTHAEMASWFGKGVADELAKKAEGHWGTIELSGLDLNIDKVGLKKVYDQDLPNVAKKLGGKVESIKINTTGKVYMEGGKLGIEGEPKTDVPSFSLEPFKGYQPTLYSGIDPTLFKSLFSRKKDNLIDADTPKRIEAYVKSRYPELFFPNLKIEWLNQMQIPDDWPSKASGKFDWLDEKVFIAPNTKARIKSGKPNLTESQIVEVLVHELQHLKESEGPLGAKGPKGTSYAEWEAHPVEQGPINIGREARKEFDKLLKDKGFALYSGIPVDKLTAEAKAAGRKFADSMKRDREAHSVNAKEVAKTFREEFNKNWLTQSGNIRRKLELYGDKGYQIIEAQSLGRQGHPHATAMFNQMRRESRKGLSSDELKIRDDLIMADRMVAIGKTEAGKRFQYPEGKSPAESAFYIEQMMHKDVNGLVDLSPEREAKVRLSAQIYSDWQRRVVDDAFAGQIIDFQEQADLKAQNYRRLGLKDVKLFKIFDKRREVQLGGKKMMVYDSGISSIASGKRTDLFEPNADLMALESFNRLYNRIHNNEANLSLWNLAHEDKQNPFVRVREREIAELAEQPKDKAKLIQSIEIKRLEQGMSDYTLSKQLRERFKTGKYKNLSIEDLAKFDLSLGEKSKEYVKGSGEKIPTGWKRNFVYVNGSRRTQWLEPSFASEWLTSNPQMTGKFARFVRRASLAPITRTFATGVEIAFGFKNIPRDVNHAWFAARTFENGKWKPVYSTFAPKFLGEIGHDFASVIGDVLLRKGKYIDAMEDGMGMDLLVMEARPFKKGLRLETNVDKIFDFLSYINQTSELSIRLAIRDRVIRTEAKKLGISVEEAAKNKEIRKRASFAALDQMNFGEGGGFAKALDTGIPYLNARIVGTRSLFRSFRPESGTAKQSMLKIMQFAGVAVGLYLWNKFRSPETMAALEGDRRTQGNFVIPLGDGLKINEDGEDRYPFLVIPIDQSQRFFKTLFEAFTDKWIGDPVDVGRVVQSLKDASPADITTLPPSLAALLGYVSNKNFWLNEDIWRRTDESFSYQLPRILTKAEVGGSEEEYMPGRTPEALRAIGTATGLSPDRLKAALSQIINSDSTYAYLLGTGYEKVFGSLPKDRKDQTLAQTLSKVPVIKSFFKLTNPRAKHGGELATGKEQSIIKNFVENRGLDFLAYEHLYKETIKMSEIMDYIDKDPVTGKYREKNVVERLRDRYEFTEKIKDLPNKSFWLTLKGIQDVNGRAKTYVDILTKANPKERDKLLREEMQVLAIERTRPPGFKIFSDEFKNAVIRLQYQEVKYPVIR